MKTALLINVSQIGDIVSSTVVADSLIQSGVDVHFIMPEFVHALFESDQTLTLWAPDNLPKQTYDLVVDLTSNKESRKIIQRVNAKKKIGRVKDFWQRCRHWLTYSCMVPKQLDGHIVRDYYPVLHALNDEQPRQPRLLPVPELPQKLGLADDAKIVAIHFGASNIKRLVPLPLLSHAIQWLHRHGYQIVLMGTETAVGNELVALNQGIPLFMDLSLGDVRNVLSRSKLFIGADSGILHIAAALNCPSIGIYGPNVPARAGPLSAAVTFFELDLDCRPCNQNVDCPWDNRCMTMLDKNELIRLIQARLAAGV